MVENEYRWENGTYFKHSTTERSSCLYCKPLFQLNIEVQQAAVMVTDVMSYVSECSRRYRSLFSQVLLKSLCILHTECVLPLHCEMVCQMLGMLFTYDEKAMNARLKGTHTFRGQHWYSCCGPLERTIKLDLYFCMIFSVWTFHTKWESVAQNA